MIGYAVIEADLGYILKLPALHSAYFYFKAFWYYEVTGNISTFPFLLLQIFLGCLMNLYLGARALERV